MRDDLTQRVLAADRQHVWHPYTPMDEWRARHDPLLVVGAQGPYLELASGERLIDGVGSWWVSTLGHNHPRLVAALKRQADALCHCALAGITHEPAALLAEELAAVAPPGLQWSFFSDDGSTAIEAAVKMALQFHQQVAPHAGKRKGRFVALDGAFHGETVGAASLGGVSIFRRPFASVLFDCIHVPVPTTRTPRPDWSQAFDALAKLLATQGDDVAGLVLEPLVQGAAGMRMYSPDYLRAAADLCRRHDVLLIVDEVFTGYGRLGAMWACDLAGIAPDLLCLGKGFTAGVLPMAATLATERVLCAFDGGRARAFLYGHSFAGNPLGAAVAREVLAIYREEAILDGIAPRAAAIADSMQRLAASSFAERSIVDTRALGMIGAVELRADAARTSEARATSIVPTLETEGDLQGGYAASVGWLVAAEARRRGVYLRPLGDVVYLTPPLNIPMADLQRLLNVFEESIAAVVAKER